MNEASIYVDEIVTIGRSFLSATSRFFKTEIGERERNSSARRTPDLVNTNTPVRVSVRVSRTSDDTIRSAHFTTTTFNTRVELEAESLPVVNATTRLENDRNLVRVTGDISRWITSANRCQNFIYKIMKYKF